MTAPTLASTRELVRRLFDGVTDKGGRPYHEHCERVEARLPADATECERHAALLHDVLEDTTVTSDDLRRGGYSERTVDLVDALTRPATTTYLGYIRVISATRDHGLIQIKLADLADNLDPERIARLPAAERGLTVRYGLAREILEGALPALFNAPDIDDGQVGGRDGLR